MFRPTFTCETTILCALSAPSWEPIMGPFRPFVRALVRPSVRFTRFRTI